MRGTSWFLAVAGGGGSTLPLAEVASAGPGTGVKPVLSTYHGRPITLPVDRIHYTTRHAIIFFSLAREAVHTFTLGPRLEPLLSIAAITVLPTLYYCYAVLSPRRGSCPGSE
jgi:hypothetical protein